MSSWRVLLVTALLAAQPLACADAWRRVSASPADYGAYREYRLADTVERRLAAALRYLDRRPAGAWRAEVEAWFEREDARYIESAWNDLSALYAHRRALPNAPSAEQVGHRILELEQVAADNAARDEELDARAMRSSVLLQQAAAQRQLVVRTFAALVRGVPVLLERGRTVGISAQLVDAGMADRVDGGRAPGVAALGGRTLACRGERCESTVELPYAVPGDRELLQRVVSVFIVAEFSDVRLTRLEIAGLQLFSRVAEASQIRAIDPRDGLGRAEAIGHVLQIVELALGTAFPEASCAGDPVGPLVLDRACEGVRFRMYAATDPLEEDRVELRVIGDAGSQ